MYQTDKCVVAQVLKVVVIINLIIIDHSRMIQAFRIIEISKYDDGSQLTTHGQLMQGSSTRVVTKINGHRDKRSSEFFKYMVDGPVFVLALVFVCLQHI